MATTASSVGIRGVIVLFALIALGLGIAGVAVTQWYKVEIESSNPLVRRNMRYGLWRFCVNDVCDTEWYRNDQNEPIGCARSGWDARDRIQATSAVAVTAICLVFIGLLLVAPDGAWGRFGRLVCFVLALGFALAAIGVFAGFVRDWWWCGGDFCDSYTGPGDCHNHWGPGFGLYCGAAGAMFLAAVASIAALFAARTVTVMEQREPVVITDAAGQPVGVVEPVEPVRIRTNQPIVADDPAVVVVRT